MTSTVHATAADRLRGDGQRYTAQRRSLVDLLAEVEQPLTIPQLLERRPGLAQSSAYRNLAAAYGGHLLRVGEGTLILDDHPHH